MTSAATASIKPREAIDTPACDVLRGAFLLFSRFDQWLWLGYVKTGRTGTSHCAYEGSKRVWYVERARDLF